MTHTFDPWDEDQYDDDAPSVYEAFDFTTSGPVDSAAAGVPTLYFTTSNPAQTVSVTADFSGRVRYVELDPSVVTRTESELAAEILLLARLAQRRARAGQHAVVAEILTRRGHDRVAIGEWLERKLNLPSPRTVQEEAAAVFAGYAGNDG